jgi:ABC-2 type transport system permease protein
VTALVRSELSKIRSTRLWWGLLIGAVVYTLVQAAATAAFAGVDPGAGQPTSPGLDTPEAIRGIYAGAAFTGSYIFAMILGITGMTGEYRYQTITPTFLVVPRRARVVVAKMIAHFGVGALFGLVALVCAFVAGAVVITVRGHDLGLGAERLWPSAALAVLAVAIWTLVGIGVGTLVKGQIAAILIGVFITFLLEPLMSLLLDAIDLDAVAKFLPTNASAALTSPGSTFVDYLDWWAGGLVLLGYAAVLAGLGVVLSTRRDIS